MSVSKSWFCPIAQEIVPLFGAYEKDFGGRLALVEAHCAVIDNLKKPVEDRDKELPAESCDDPTSCPLYSGFPPFTR